MVKVQAILREERLGAVLERLVLIGVGGVTVAPVKGSGRSALPRAVFRGGSYPIAFLPRVVLEWFGDDDECDAVVRAITHAAATGVPGDGNIVVERVEAAIEIPGEPT
jgi:nitrogen regulatory protein P-II 1